MPDQSQQVELEHFDQKNHGTEFPDQIEDNE